MTEANELLPEDIEDLRKAGPEAEKLARDAAKKMGISLSDFLFLCRMKRKADALGCIGDN
jgi:hypothetical protein